MNTTLPSYFALAFDLDAVAAGDPFACIRLAHHMQELASPSGRWLEHERTPAGLRLTARCIAAMRQQSAHDAALERFVPAHAERGKSAEWIIANSDGLNAQIPQWREERRYRVWARVVGEHVHRRRQAREHRTVSLIRAVLTAERCECVEVGR